MSATGRSDVRRADDAYMTPSWCVRAIWPKLAAFQSCLDPCAGEGAILKTLRELASSPMYCGIELDEGRAAKVREAKMPCLVADALAPDVNWGDRIDLVIMNAPYSLALPFMQKALTSGAQQVCCLLRLNFLESRKRAAFWKEHPCDVWVLPKRPSFTGTGTDATGYMWTIHDRTRRNGLGHWGILDV